MPLLMPLPLRDAILFAAVATLLIFRHAMLPHAMFIAFRCYCLRCCATPYAIRAFHTCRLLLLDAATLRGYILMLYCRHYALMLIFRYALPCR